MFVVLFEVHPHAAQMQQYLDFGKLLRPELEQIDGFIDNERFASVGDRRASSRSRPGATRRR